MHTRLHRLHNRQDQSPWLDFVDRALITDGKLAELIALGIRGLTSNPTIFAKAVASGQYAELVSSMPDSSPEAIYEEIAIGDVGDAADLLRPVYDESGGSDGYASIEVEPALAHDADATLRRTRHLWERLARPNVYIKIPAIERAVSEGININVTLMFSVDTYRRVALAYVAGLRTRLERGDDVSRQSSVASFFVSRVDAKVDDRLTKIGTRAALELRGRAAIANAKMAYQAFDEIFNGSEFADLRGAGARVQRCLWASTSPKNAEFRDVVYVEELIGPQTVNTMPLQTIEAFLDHGEVARTIDAGLDAAHADLRRIEELGISLSDVTDELIKEGVAAFDESFDELLATIRGASKAAAHA